MQNDPFKPLKYIISIMGLTLVSGTFFLITAIVSKVNNKECSPENVALNLKEEVLDIKHLNNNDILIYTRNKGIIVNYCNNEIIKEITLHENKHK